jgi:iron complex outermembrane receptor protein
MRVTQAGAPERLTAARLRLLAGAMLVCLPASVAHGQGTTPEATEESEPQEQSGPQPSPSETPLETIRTSEGEVIVTARNYVPTGSISANKTDIPLIETPQSVSVITRDQIDLLNFVDSQQAVRYTAGVFGENYGPDLRFDFLTVRGFTPKQYIDGLAAPISTTIYSVGVDLYAFESLDLLKGPSSVLYGNAPPGGIYNQITRRPSRQFGGEIGVKYGEDDFRQLNATFTGPVADGISARFTGLFRDREAERDFVDAKRVLFAPAVNFRIGGRTSLTALAYYQYDRVAGETNGFLPVYGTLLPNPVGKVRRDINLGEPTLNVYRRSQYGIGYDLVHDFSDAVAFHSNVKWSRYRENTPNGVYGGGGLLDADFNGTPDDYRTVNRFNFTYREKVHSFAADNRFDVEAATGAIGHKILVGVDYRNVFNFAEFGFGPGGTIDLFNPVYTPQLVVAPPFNTVFGFPVAPFNNQRLRQTGVYAQDQLRFGNLFLTLGGRYDWVKIKNYTTDDRAKQDKFTYRVGANYVHESGFAPYISYATSFEPVLGADVVTGEQFQPSTGRQIEGGVKYDGRGLSDDVRIFATAALFKINQKNVVSATPSVLPVGGRQTGEIEVWGGEIEFVARIREQLSINGSYSYNDTEVVASSIPQEVGAPLPTTPKHKISLFADYTLRSGTLAGLGFGFGGRYHSRSAGSLPGPFNAIVYMGEEATLFDAIVHYDTPGWRFAVNGSNVFDKRYVARCASAAGCTFGAGRQVIGTVTKKF